MDYFLLFGIIGFSCLIISFIAYSTTTNKIIKDQDRDIEKLTAENKRLKARRYVKESIYIDRPLTIKKTQIVKDPFKES